MLIPMDTKAYKIMRAELCIYFCIKITSKYVDSKSALNPTPVVYATDRSKAVVLVLYVMFVRLCGFYYWPFHVESCLAIFSHVFQSCLAL